MLLKREKQSMIKITIIGDIMCEPMLIRSAKKGDSFNFGSLFNNVTELFKDSDYVIGNLETPLGGKKASFCKDLYSFNAPDEFAEALKNAGINFVTTANNHCLDRGYDGLKRTIKILDDLGIKHCGTSLQNENRIGYFNIKDKRFAVVCGTYGTNFADNHEPIPQEHPECVNMLRSQNAIPFYKTCSRPKPERKNSIGKPLRGLRKIMKILGFLPWKIQQAAKLFHQGQTIPYPDNYAEGELPNQYSRMLLNDLQNAKNNADFVIFLPHMGGQFNKEPGSFSQYFTNLAAESGLCNAVIASHPHVVQKAEMISKIPCFFSIGNFNMSPNSFYIPDSVILREHLGLEQIVNRYGNKQHEGNCHTQSQ